MTNLDCIPWSIVRRHLAGRGYSKSRIEEEIVLFKAQVLMIARWRILSPLNIFKQCGVQLHVLGHGLKQVFPFVLCLSAVGLQQQINAGLRGGNCKHPCPNCMFNMKNPTMENYEYPGRDFARIQDLLYSAESVSKATIIYSKNDKDMLKIIRQRYSLLPFYNQLFDLDWGPGNNIFRCGTPADVLHTSLGGIVKMVCRWLILIIVRCAQIKREEHMYCDRFDSRIRDMAYHFKVYNIPNVPWEPFRTGLIDKCNSINSRK